MRKRRRSLVFFFFLACLPSCGAAASGAQERDAKVAGDSAEASPRADARSSGTTTALEQPPTTTAVDQSSAGHPAAASALARPRSTGLDSLRVAGAVALADSLPRLHCLLVARHGEVLVEHCAEGLAPDRPVNVKSVSKSVLSALVGIAIGEGHLEGVGQRAWGLLGVRDSAADPRKRDITVGHLLSMQSGLERTSGGNYGGWVQSADWVRNAMSRPMVAEPGGPMLYSTGNYHLLSAILTARTGQSTFAYARSRLAEPLGISLPRWARDPQGIYFGGNEMLLSPRAMIRFGELYRNGGRRGDAQVVPAEWIHASLEPRTRSRWSGDGYGYGWFIGQAGGYPMFYALGYGGQYIIVVPDLELTVAVTSDPYASREGGHRRAIRELLGRWIVPAAELGGGGA